MADDGDDDFDNIMDEDDELKADSDFMENVDIMANYDDMDQDMKGDDIHFIGDVQALGKE